MNKKKIMFAIHPEFIEQYSETLNAGKKYLSNKNIVITGLVRNAGSSLEESVDGLSKLEQFGCSLNYFIYENDSNDNTKDVLKNIQSNNSNFNFLSEDLSLPKFGSVKSLERTTNLANHRNKCLNHIKENHKDSDFVIVIDLDFRSMSLEGLVHSFGIYSKHYFSIDGIAGNSFEIKKHEKSGNVNLWNYDSWAYRGNWWTDLHSYPSLYTHDPMLWFGLWQPPIGSHPIQINSAFGGCCIYKTEKYILGKYDGYDCEHVTFHKYLSDNHDFKLWLNPAQIMLF